MALTGGKYSGWGRLNRKRYRDDDDQPPDDRPELVLTKEGETKIFK